LDAGDPGKAFELVHSLISTAGAIGASVLSEAARELQLAIDAGETLRWPSLVRELEDEHHAVAEELRSYLSGKGGSEDEPVQAVPSAGPGNPDRVGSIGT
jgi:HPt (histidine-containing phosphotransfer) domain-containing protein